MAVKIYDLEFDDDNESEIARHGITQREVRQVLDGTPRFFPNTKGHSAALIMVGRTAGGRLLTVPLAPSALRDVWRPATAFDSNRREQSLYVAAGGR